MAAYYDQCWSADVLSGGLASPLYVILCTFILGGHLMAAYDQYWRADVLSGGLVCPVHIIFM